jgi:riboflavin kinase/FMN adenylyltransferase
MRVVVIGNFDGVHCGHRHLLRTARTLAGATRVAAVTFEPLPVEVLRPGAPMGRLTPAPVRRALLLAEGVADEVVELDPRDGILGLDPDAFVEFLRREHPFGAIVEGPDFRFGRGRAGSLATLRDSGERLGFAVVEAALASVTITDGTVVEARSSAIRALLAEGRVADAACVLGRPFELVAPTVRGDQRGRTIGWPTANLDAAGWILPADGVYAGEATLPDGTVAIAAISVGTKPTFGESARTCETTLLAQNGVPLELPLDWYGWTLRLRFHRFIRAQIRFDGVEALLERMELDRAAIVAAVAGAGGAGVGAPRVRV